MGLAQGRGGIHVRGRVAEGSSGSLVGRHLQDKGVDVTGAHGWAESGTPHEGLWPARLTGSERRASDFSSELHTQNSSLVFSHPRNHLRGARPSAPKRGPSGLTRRAGPLGPGRSHWAVARDSGRRAVLPFVPNDVLSLSTGGLPRWAPEHLPGSFIYAVSALCQRRGAQSSYFTIVP